MTKLFHFRWVSHGSGTLESYDVDEHGRLTNNETLDGRAGDIQAPYPCLLKNGEIFSRKTATLQATPPLELMGLMGLHFDSVRQQIDLWTDDEALATAMPKVFALVVNVSYDRGNRNARGVF